MDSKLDSIFRTNFRPAEKSDAWLGINRHDPDQPQRKKEDRDKEEKPEEFEDNATISVPALHAFLKTLLQQAAEPARNRTTPSQTDTPDGDMPHPVNKQAANAALAYQNTARHTPGGRIDLSDQAPAPETAQGPSIQLGQDDLRTIHQLLDEVQLLANRGIHVITIEKADTFLESLARGVQTALNSR